MTSIVNNLGEMIPRSKPTFKTISSTRPLVFIKIPNVIDSDHEYFRVFAEISVPPNFPTVATKIIIRQSIQS